jgi:hypothetical protein
MTAVEIKNLPGLQVSTLENENSKLQRLGTLNDSYRKRYATYTKLAAMVVVFLVGFIIIQMAEPMIPPVVGNILMIALILFVGYYIATYFSELGSRSPLNYDELNISTKNPGDTKDTPTNLGGSSASDLIPEDITCAESWSMYSNTMGKCIPNCNVINSTNKYYHSASGTCTNSSTKSPADETVIDTSTESFTLGSSSFQTSGEQHVDKSRMSLPISAVGATGTGLIPSNEVVDKYSPV